jgi:3-oxoacyl-(acyl-carrier-protein) synthase
MRRRVVVTGLGVVAPNAVGVADFETALREGRSGIRRNEAMVEHGFACQVAGVPQGADELAEKAFDGELLLAMNQSHRYAGLAAVEAWQDAGLVRPPPEGEPDWDAGAVLGTGIGGMDTIGGRVVPLVDAKKVRRLGSTAVEQVMASGVSARVSGILALGNQVTTNSSACSTGTEAVAQGCLRIRHGLAERMLCGGVEAASHYIWAGFDAMRVLARSWNDDPERASRPLSASAGGFVPGAGAGVLLLESLESALARGARIRAEVLGVALNCGGHRGGGSMTAPNPTGVERCIRAALRDGAVEPERIDVVNGHLTATGADPREVASWARALGRGPGRLPLLTATKSLIGHALGAAGGIECAASVLMVERDFVHASRNCEDVHPEIEAFADAIVHESRPAPVSAVAKAGFGFGDVNAVVVFGKWKP